MYIAAWLMCPLIRSLGSPTVPFKGNVGIVRRFLLSVDLLKDGVCQSLGEDMYEAHREGDAMLEAVEFYDEDSTKLEDVKSLILHMTSFQAKDRPSAEDVYHQISAIYKRKSKVRSVSCKWVIMQCVMRSNCGRDWLHNSFSKST